MLGLPENNLEFLDRPAARLLRTAGILVDHLSTANPAGISPQVLFIILRIYTEILSWKFRSLKFSFYEGRNI